MRVNERHVSVTLADTHCYCACAAACAQSTHTRTNNTQQKAEVTSVFLLVGRIRGRNGLNYCAGCCSYRGVGRERRDCTASVSREERQAHSLFETVQSRTERQDRVTMTNLYIQ
jgi:hypothetical protein